MEKKTTMKRVMRLIMLVCLVAALTIPVAHAFATQQAATPATAKTAKEEKPIKKILFIGDSMTGWLAEALNGYGKANGFEVATIVWDGSTMRKWANSRLADIIKEQNPDAVFISLGMNELFEAKPDARLSEPLKKIKNAVGDRKMVWVGPPSWPGKQRGEVLNNWLEKELGDDVYFRSYDLQLKRQSATNPHPSRQGMLDWVDALVQWIPANTDLKFESLNKPATDRMVRGKTFIYKRMKETL